MSIVRDALIAELKEAVQKSVDLVKERDEAKTEFKKDLFTKRLIENNKYVAQLSEAFTKLPELEKQVEDEQLTIPSA